MTDFDPEAFYEETGIDVRLGGAPKPEPPLSSAGAQAQADVLQSLRKLHAALEMIEVIVRDRPNDDATFDTFNAAFGQRLEEARAFFLRFRDRRDCRGAA